MGSPHPKVLVPQLKWPVSPVAGTENSLTIFCSSSPSYFCFTFPPLHGGEVVSGSNIAFFFPLYSTHSFPSS